MQTGTNVFQVLPTAEPHINVPNSTAHRYKACLQTKLAICFQQGFRCRTSKHATPPTRFSPRKKAKHPPAQQLDHQGLGRDRQGPDDGSRTEQSRAAGWETAEVEECKTPEAACITQACSPAVEVTGKREAGGGQQAAVKPEGGDAAAPMGRVSASMEASVMAMPATDAAPAAAAVAEAAAQAMMAEVCRKARGRQNICLEGAVGVPERLGDHPLRLIILGNNPSDHAWCGPLYI